MTGKWRQNYSKVLMVVFVILSDSFCRVKGMLMVNVLAIAAGLLMGLCRMWKPHIMVIAGRAVMGFYCGNINSHVTCVHAFVENTDGFTLNFRISVLNLDKTWTKERKKMLPFCSCLTASVCSSQLARDVCFRVDIWARAYVHWRDCTQGLQRGSGDVTPAGYCHRHPY